MRLSFYHYTFLIIIQVLVGSTMAVQKYDSLTGSHYNLSYFMDATDTIYSVQIALAGKTILTASADGLVRIYKLNDKNQMVLNQTITEQLTKLHCKITQNQTQIFCGHMKSIIWRSLLNGKYVIKQQIEIKQASNDIDDIYLSRSCNYLTVTQFQTNTTYIYNFNGTLFTQFSKVTLGNYPNNAIIQQPFLVIAGNFSLVIYKLTNNGTTIFQNLNTVYSYVYGITANLYQNRQGYLVFGNVLNSYVYIYYYNGDIFTFYQSIEVGSIYSLSISPNGKYIIVSNSNSTILLLENQIGSFNPIQQFQQSNTDNQVALISTGQLLATGGEDKKLIVYYLCNVDYCSNCSWLNICSQCIDGYNLKESKCQKIKCHVTNCQICQSTQVCKQCITGYKLQNKICSSLVCNVEHCVSCDQENSCRVCQDGFLLDYNVCIDHNESNIGYIVGLVVLSVLSFLLLGIIIYIKCKKPNRHQLINQN